MAPLQDFWAQSQVQVPTLSVNGRPFKARETKG